MTHRIFIVEDHLMMQKTLKLFISRMADFEVVGMAESASQALEALSQVVPDLVLVDMSLPQTSGAELVSSIRKQWPDILCVLYSGHGEPSYVEQALKAGAHGYILKGKPAELEPALQLVLAGERYVSDSLEPPSNSS